MKITALSSNHKPGIFNNYIGMLLQEISFSNSPVIKNIQGMYHVNNTIINKHMKHCTCFGIAIYNQMTC
jgi:hypothetical protein